MQARLLYFPGVYLQDTWVLAWRQEGDRLIFDVEVSLWPGHEHYVRPRRNEWTCYRKGELVFEGVRDIQGLRAMKDVRPTIDPDGSADYETIDSLLRDDDGTFLVAGEFGQVRVIADRVGLMITDAG